MRIGFVPEDHLHRRPALEVRELAPYAERSAYCYERSRRHDLLAGPFSPHPETDKRQAKKNPR
jgi:hypothetical protein